MPSKVCDKCYGSGQISHVMGSGTSYQHCYQCDGAGTIYYTEPTPPPPPTPRGGTSGTKGGGNGGTNSPRPTRANNSKGLQTLLALAAGVGGYFLSVVYVTDSLIVAGIIGIVALAITYKWHKQIVILTILAGLAYYFFFRD